MRIPTPPLACEARVASEGRHEWCLRVAHGASSTGRGGDKGGKNASAVYAHYTVSRATTMRGREQEECAETRDGKREMLVEQRTSPPHSPTAHCAVERSAGAGENICVSALRHNATHKEEVRTPARK